MNSQDYSKKYRTWIEVSCLAIERNYKTFRGLISEKTALMAVVKSNAYGHGIIEMAHELEKLDVDWFGVDSAVEGLVLRREGVTKPILALGYTLPDKFTDVVNLGLHMSVSTFEQLKEIKHAGLSEKISVHIKVDTGMHRQGFMMKDVELLFKALGEMKDTVEVAGLFTHFASAKDPNGPDATKRQIAEFKEWMKLFQENGYNPICHASATAGALLYPEAHFDMVRIGIGMYGLWPSNEVYEHTSKTVSLEPALSWKTIVSEVKELPKGECVGYDFTEELIRDSKVAICPVGYWHGYSRMLSSKAEVLVCGARAKLIGRVSMGMIVIDVTDISNVVVGDVVTLLGKDCNEEVTAEELAQIEGTSWYETVTCINPRIKRVTK